MSYGGDEYEYEWPDDGNDQEGWGDEDVNNEGEPNPRVQVENMFYEADGNMKDRPEEAINQFENCILMEENLEGEIVHRFKAMENIIILSARLHKYDTMKEYHSKMLRIISKVARNDVSDAINNILDAV